MASAGDDLLQKALKCLDLEALQHLVDTQDPNATKRYETVYDLIKAVLEVEESGTRQAEPCASRDTDAVFGMAHEHLVKAAALVHQLLEPTSGADTEPIGPFSSDAHTSSAASGSSAGSSAAVLEPSSPSEAFRVRMLQVLSGASYRERRAKSRMFKIKACEETLKTAIYVVETSRAAVAEMDNSENKDDDASKMMRRFELMGV